MLILIPILAIFEAYILVFAWRKRREDIGEALSSALIYTLGGSALFTVLATEGLSLFHAITRLNVTVIWCVAALVPGYFIWRRHILKETIGQIYNQVKTIRFNKMETLLLVGIGVYLLVLLVIAFVAPPNNNDSLQYHLARILHWVENHDLGYFPVVYLPELFNPPGAEIFLLHNYLLVGSDRLLNLQQWGAMALSLVIVASIAKKLGTGRLGQWLAVIYLLCLPIGILESTSTQNDYVMAFWILCLAYLVIKTNHQKRSWIEILYAGILAGLAMLTKIPAYAYVAIILIWAILSNLRVEGTRRIVLQSLVILAMLFAINLPGWIMNTTTFGNPLGESDIINSRNPDLDNPSYYLISPLQHLSLNFGTPFQSLNHSIERSIVSTCNFLGGENCGSSSDQEWEYHIVGLSNHEDSAGNPIHFILFSTALVILIINRKRFVHGRALLDFTLMIISCFLLESWLIIWSAYYVRLQLPLFAMGAVVFGITFETLKPKLGQAIMIGLLLAGSPWLFLNRTRPIIGMTPDVTLVGSIFRESRDSVFFANFPDWQDQVRAVTTDLVNSGCKEVSLRLDSRDPEYYFTYYLDPLHTGIQFEVESKIPLVQKYRKQDFEPCAVICAICGYDPDPTGLILAEKIKGMTLYLSPEYYERYKAK